MLFFTLRTTDILTTQAYAAGQTLLCSFVTETVMPKPIAFCSYASIVICSTAICSRCPSPCLASDYSPHPSQSAPMLFSSMIFIHLPDHTHSLVHLFLFQLSLAFPSSSQNIAPPSHITHRQPVFG